MNRPDIVEIWIGDQVLVRIDSSFAPVEGDLINVERVTYVVVGRSFAIDDASDAFNRQLRCNVIVEVAQSQPDGTPDRSVPAPEPL